MVLSIVKQRSDGIDRLLALSEQKDDEISDDEQ